MTHEPIPVADPGSEDWHLARLTGIGASEAGKMLGVSPYGTALDVYLEKTGVTMPFIGNKHTERGKRWEHRVLEDFMEESGLELKQYPVPMYRHPIHTWMLATPDAVMVRDEKDLGAELKTTESWAVIKDLGECASDNIPDTWLLQGQQQMAVMGWDTVYVPVMLGFRIRTFKVARNEDLIKIITARGKELWDRIMNRQPPDPDFSHSTTIDTLRQLHNVVEGKRVELSPAAAIHWFESVEIGKQIRELEARKDSLRSRVLHEMKDAALGTLPTGKEVVRKIVNAAEYTVAPRKYEKLYERKATT